MANLLQDGARFLASALSAGCSVQVFYCRGTDQIRWDATPSDTRYQILESDGTLIEYQSRDYKGPVGDLEIDGALVEPAPGDTILERFESEDLDRTFEVMALGASPCWQWGDDYHETRTIHTKEVTAT